MDKEYTDSSVANSENDDKASANSENGGQASGIDKLIFNLKKSSGDSVQSQINMLESAPAHPPENPEERAEGLAELVGEQDEDHPSKFADGPFRERLKDRARQRAHERANPLTGDEAAEENRTRQERKENARVTRTQITALKKNEEPAKETTKTPFSIRPLIFVCIFAAVLFVFGVGALFSSHNAPNKIGSDNPEVNPKSQSGSGIASLNGKSVKTAAGSTDVKGLLAKARADYKANNKSTALNEFYQAIKLAPEDATVYVARADYYYSEHNLSSAAADYKRAIELNPRLESAKKRLARCAPTPVESDATAEEKPATSTFSASESADLKKLSFDDLRLKGYNALQANNTNFAVAALSKCVKIKPNDAATRRYLAFASLQKGDTELAISQFRAWDSLDKSDLGSKMSFAKTLATNGENVEVAKGVLNSLVRQNSRNAEALITITQTCIDSGITDGPALRALRLASVVADSAQKEQILTLYESINSKHDEPSKADGASNQAEGSQAKLPAGFDANEYRARASKSGE